MSAAHLFAVDTGLPVDSRPRPNYGQTVGPLAGRTLAPLPPSLGERGRLRVITRPRLLEALDESHARVRMLVAPSGYGKTVLARQWLAGRRLGWYRGNEACADIAVVATRLAAAASLILPGAGDSMVRRLRATGIAEEDVDLLSEMLADDLAGWPRDAWLVFDDYQYACASPFSERFVERILDLSPVRLFVTSDTRPSWASPDRFRAGDLLEVGPNALAITLEEAALVMQRRTADETRALHALCDGWPAAIGMAALTDGFPTDHPLVGAELYDHFAVELYESASEPTQSGLLNLALAPPGDEALTKAVVGDDWKSVVAEATRLGLLLSSELGLPEMHALTRSFLSNRLPTDSAERDLTRAAKVAETLVDAEEWDGVLSLLPRFFDPNVLNHLFEASLKTLLREGRSATVAAATRMAADHALDSGAVLLAQGELALRRGEMPTAYAFAAHATTRLTQRNRLASCAHWLAGTAAHLMNDDEIAIKHHHLAKATAKSRVDKAQAAWGEFVATQSLDDVPRARECFASYLQVREDTPEGYVRAATGELLLALMTGGIVEAVARTSPVLEARPRPVDPLVASSALSTWRACQAVAGRYRETLAGVRNQETVELCQMLPFFKIHMASAEATALIGLGRLKAAEERVNYHSPLRRPQLNGVASVNLRMLLTRIHLLRGDFDHALEAVGHYSLAPETIGINAERLAWKAVVHWTMGDLQLAQAEAAKAASLSRRPEVAGVVTWVECAMTDFAARNVYESFEQTCATGNIDAFVTIYRLRDYTVRQLWRHPETRPRLREILTEAGDVKLLQTLDDQSFLRRDDPVARLTRREREILILVGEGLRNAEIARKLYIQPSTVKLHVQHILKKLEVRTRTEAALRARELIEN